MKAIDLFDLYQIALDAGKEILEVYQNDFDVEVKTDDSPLTEADKRAHKTIMSGLTAIDPSIPVISEEGSAFSYQERSQWSQFWLVDPLDGTKEFVKRNGEFTVNIALIEGRYPSIGIIYAPVLDVLYYGCAEKGAYKLEHASKTRIATEAELIKNSVSLAEKENRPFLTVVASRSHMSAETKNFIKELEANHGKVEVVSSGSSLKFCLVAEGKADYYPRYAPTMEWDTAAGQAIVEAAGGKVTRYEDDERFFYNREELRNGWFLVQRT